MKTSAPSYNMLPILKTNCTYSNTDQSLAIQSVFIDQLQKKTAKLRKRILNFDTKAQIDFNKLQLAARKEPNEEKN